MAKSTHAANALPSKALFVVCGGGLEGVLMDELRELGFTTFHPSLRGVYVDIEGIQDIYKINYCSRIATRVLLPLQRFRAQHRDALYQAISKIDWSQYITPQQTFAIDANVSGNPNLKHSLFAAMVVKDALCDQIREKTGQRPNVSLNAPDLQLNLFINGDKAVISIDTSGAPLHQRGYRQSGGDAPMQETLAAALLRMGGGFGPLQRLLDPCCGSGTLLIEAAWMATRTAPGCLRKQWGFMHLPQYNASDWLKFREKVNSQQLTLPKGDIVGVELSQENWRACKDNLRAAGLHPYIEVHCQDFRRYQPTQSFDVICANPPHGRRLSSEAGLVGLYRDIGTLSERSLRQGGRCWVFTSQESLGHQVGHNPKLVLEEQISLKQGKEPGWLFAYGVKS